MGHYDHWTTGYSLVNELLYFYYLFDNEYFLFSEGGFFKARMSFPKSYPQMPPKLQFISEIWHPNGKSVPVK